MRNVLFVVFVMIVIASCRRNEDLPQPPGTPLLKRSVAVDAATGNVSRVMYYNEMELVVSDTTFNASTHIPALINEYTYNAKGKCTKMANQTLVIQPGPYWGWEYFFQDDTIPTVTERYLKGNRVAKITHFYNAAGQRILDSTYHTPNYGTFTYLLKYVYDVQGRLSYTIDLNDVRDSVLYTTYQYIGNTVEKREKRFYYDPTFVQYRTTITEYVQPGVIATEKVFYGETPSLAIQTDYSYDGAGRLLKKTIMTVGGTPQEDRYYYNDFGKVEKLEVYYSNQLRSITTYYYE